MSAGPRCVAPVAGRLCVVMPRKNRQKLHRQLRLAAEARKQDQRLRTQAAKVIAHRTTIEQKMEDAADAVGEARETAKQALPADTSAPKAA